MEIHIDTINIYMTAKELAKIGSWPFRDLKKNLKQVSAEVNLIEKGDKEIITSGKIFANKYPLKTCKRCGCKFEDITASNNRKYCSNKCRGPFNKPLVMDDFESVIKQVEESQKKNYVFGE